MNPEADLEERAARQLLKRLNKARYRTAKVSSYGVLLTMSVRSDEFARRVMSRVTAGGGWREALHYDVVYNPRSRSCVIRILVVGHYT